MEVGFRPGHIVIDGDPAPLPQKLFGPCLLWPNGWMDQDATWYGDRLGPSDFVLDGDQAPLLKKGAKPLILGACLL